MLRLGARRVAGLGGLRHAHTNHKAGTEAVRFALSPYDAEHEAFPRWTEQETRFWIAKKPHSVTPVYLPFWAFEGTIHTASGAHDLASDPLLSQFYAGYDYRRSMVDVVKTDLDTATPLSADMLYKPRSWDREIEVNAFEVYEDLAWAHVSRALQQEYGNFVSGVENLQSRRVLLPAFVVEYSHLGLDFRVFISGDHGKAYGIEQERMVKIDPKRIREEIVTVVQNTMRHRSSMQHTSLAYSTVAAGAKVLSAAMRFFFMRMPLFSALAAGGFVMRRVAVGLRQLRSHQEWEAIKEEEQEAQSGMHDTWRMQRHSSSSSSSASQGGFSREERERRARERQREREDRQRRAHSESQERKRRTQREEQEQARRRDEYARAPKSKDPLVVLGFAPGSSPTQAEIKAHYRREIVKWHPDHHKGEHAKALATERAKAINVSYAALRSRSRSKK